MDTSRFRSLILCVLFCSGAAGSLHGNSITINSISGNANSLHADFSMVWEAPGSAGWIERGSWEGGTWEYVFGLSTADLGHGPEGFMTFTLRSFWNDGWIPGGLGSFLEFTIGTSGSGYVSLFYERPPSVAQDYSGLGLQYFMDATAFLSLSSASDTSGSTRLVFDIIRSPVPEAGGSLLFLGLALVAIGVAQRVRQRV